MQRTRWRGPLIWVVRGHTEGPHDNWSYLVQGLRTSIAGAMIAVAVIGLEVAAARAGFSSGSEPIRLLSHQCALMVLAAQVAVYLAARARRHRLFWLGFTASGMIAALSMIADPPGIAGLWSSYFSWQGGFLLRSPELLRFIVSHRGLLSLVAVVSYGVPQLVVGIAGGLLAVGVGRIVQGVRRGEVPAGDANGR